MITVPKLNYRRFGFQAVLIWSSITIQIQFQWRIRVDDRNFDIISICFWFKSISFDVILIKNDRFKDQNCWLKDWKYQNLSEKLIYFDFFDINWSLSISFQLKSFDIDLFDIIQTHFNQFPRTELKPGFKFELKKSIKRQFDHYVSWFGDLDWLHCLSLTI